MPPWMRYFFIGLDHQVEHHLFPTIPHQQMARARDLVRAWCEERGLPHHEIGYARALVSVTSFMRGAWDYRARSRDEVRHATRAAAPPQVQGPFAAGVTPHHDAAIPARATYRLSTADEPAPV